MTIKEYKNSLGIERDDMPQIDGHLVPHFVAHLTETLGIRTSIGFKPTINLKPTQKQFNQARVDAKLKLAEEKGVQTLFKPVMISGYTRRILDGHNTVETIKQYNLKHNTCHNVLVFIIEYDILDLLKFAELYQYSYKKSINQTT
jgi:protein tyrosine phosphatase (PTP) superfamily phosphohydrolase (DUF442 family)